MVTTARNHFDEDIGRAEAMLEQARVLEIAAPADRLHDDVRIAAIAHAVGAMDAYLCDKYVDCLSRVLRAYAQGDWAGQLPTFYKNERLPVGEVLDTSRTARPAWGIRMAARAIMEKDNMLSPSRVDDMFNPVLPVNQKLWSDFIPLMLAHGYKHLTGPRTNAEIKTLAGKDREAATKKAISSLKARLGAIVQIRHDWIHNCGRPKTAIARYSHGEARLRIRDIRLFVETFDDHIEAHRKA